MTFGTICNPRDGVSYRERILDDRRYHVSFHVRSSKQTAENGRYPLNYYYLSNRFCFPFVTLCARISIPNWELKTDTPGTNFPHVTLDGNKTPDTG